MLDAVDDSGSRRAQAEALIGSLYTRIGKPAPRFLWFDDPISGLLAGSLLEHLTPELNCREDLAGSTRLLKLTRPPPPSIRRHLRPFLDEILHRQINLTLGLRLVRGHSRLFLHSFWQGFLEQLERAVGTQLMLELRRALEAAGCSAREPVGRYGARYFEGWWGGVLAGGATQASETSPPATRRAALQRTCGWFVPFGGFVVCADRPHEIRVDRNMRLHAAEGPALVLSPWHEFHRWHGRDVPRSWIEWREGLDLWSAFLSGSHDQARTLAEIVGWRNLFERFHSVVVDADPDPAIGVLFECDIPRLGAVRLLRVRCGTGRVFVLCVPPEARTAREANAWTYGFVDDEYQLEARA